METETVKKVKLNKQGRCLYMLHEVGTRKGDIVFSNKFYMGIQFDAANGVTEEDAEQFTCHVQTAVNSHYELLEALKKLYMDVYAGNSRSLQEAMNRAPKDDPFEQEIIAVLKKATLLTK